MFHIAVGQTDPFVGSERATAVMFQVVIAQAGEVVLETANVFVDGIIGMMFVRMKICSEVT